MFTGPGTFFVEDEASRREDIKDGADLTITIVEAAEAVPWTKPEDLAFEKEKPLPELEEDPPFSFNIAPSNYVSSAGTKNPAYFPRSCGGNFFRNSAVTAASISQGMSSTLMVGERSRDLSDANWPGGASANNCTGPSWPVQVCDPAGTSWILSHTGPEPETPFKRRE